LLIIGLGNIEDIIMGLRLKLKLMGTTLLSQAMIWYTMKNRLNHPKVVECRIILQMEVTNHEI